MEILKTVNLSKKYPDGNRMKQVLKEINLSLSRGDFVGLYGPSGSGKSTLLNLIGGLDRPTDGQIYLEGERIDNLSQSQLAIYRRRRIGIVYQFYNLISNLTLEQNIKLPLLMDNKEVDLNYYNRLMNVIGLEHRQMAFPDELSGGEQQRVAIARALINKPSLVLLDEPTGNLDRKNRDGIMELLRLSNQAFNQTMVIVSHDQEVINRTDRVIQLEDGTIKRDVVIK